jgi:hypothetical protein
MKEKAMTWNYRIVKWDKTPEGQEFAEYAEPVYAIHEVYYNEAGEPWSRTLYQDGPTAESPEELIKTLEMMLHDARKHPVMIEPAEWADGPKVDRGEYISADEFLAEIAAGGDAP